MSQVKASQTKETHLFFNKEPSVYSKVVIYSGGTMVHVRPHFSLCAPAYGKIGCDIEAGFLKHYCRNDRLVYDIYETNMAGGCDGIETNDDLKEHLLKQLEDPQVKCIIMAAAICDFKPTEIEAGEGHEYSFGKDEPRLSSSTPEVELYLEPSEKIIDLIKSKRPDIMLVTFKTTSGETSGELYHKAKKNLIRSSSDIVFGNDIKNHHNLLAIGEGAMATGTRDNCIETLVSLIKGRLVV